MFTFSICLQELYDWFILHDVLDTETGIFAHVHASFTWQSLAVLSRRCHAWYAQTITEQTSKVGGRRGRVSQMLAYLKQA